MNKSRRQDVEEEGEYVDSEFEKKLLKTIQIDGDMTNVFNSSMRDQLPRPAY